MPVKPKLCIEAAVRRGAQRLWHKLCVELHACKMPMAVHRYDAALTRSDMVVRGTVGGYREGP